VDVADIEYFFELELCKVPGPALYTARIGRLQEDYIALSTLTKDNPRAHSR
jgi:hypothetical protein